MFPPGVIPTRYRGRVAAGAHSKSLVIGIALLLSGVSVYASPPVPPPGDPDVVDVRLLDAMPRPTKQVAPVFPYNMSAAGVLGRVDLLFIVDREGKVRNPYVVESNNPWFERPAIDAVLKWEFTPGIRDGRAVLTRMSLPLIFRFSDEGGSDYWRMTKSRNHDKLPEPFQWDEPPKPRSTVFAVYPFEALSNRERAKFRFAMVVDADGRVERVLFDDEPPAAFAGAARAMADMWVFEAAKRQGQPCFAIVSMELDFNPGGRGTVPVSRSASDILRELNRRQPRIVAADELDAMPRPVSRRPPAYPAALRAEDVEGEALIEFFIDRWGDAQLPRVVSATREEFGYAAAQTVASWRFEPPIKDGRPVIARARIPVKFVVRER